ncbi:MAG TPA: hypothetical protein VHQ95_08090 [Pyrinomonadaceae bacterium]|jgi:hypothetical protein|nr:hypothetical protein [Pyrinomonadaceae bacterium]
MVQQYSFTSLPVKVHVMVVDAVARAAIGIVAISGSNFRIGAAAQNKRGGEAWVTASSSRFGEGSSVAYEPSAY